VHTTAHVLFSLQTSCLPPLPNPLLLSRCVLLVAFNPDKAPPDDLQTALAAAEAAAAAAAAAEAGSSSSSSGNNGFAGDALQLPGVFAFPGTGYWLSRLVDRPVWPGLGRTHEELGGWGGDRQGRGFITGGEKSLGVLQGWGVKGWGG